jgi:hypothetical protein
MWKFRQRFNTQHPVPACSQYPDCVALSASLFDNSEDGRLQSAILSTRGAFPPLLFPYSTLKLFFETFSFVQKVKQSRYTPWRRLGGEV